MRKVKGGKKIRENRSPYSLAVRKEVVRLKMAGFDYKYIEEKTGVPVKKAWGIFSKRGRLEDKKLALAAKLARDQERLPELAASWLQFSTLKKTKVTPGW